MADPKTKRLNPTVLQTAIDTVNALNGVAGYQPANADYALAKAQTAIATHLAARAAETQAEAAFKAARDNAVAAEQALQTMALGVRDQVIAQFGKDSNEVQAVGLKKKSERKTPVRPKPKAS